MKNKAERIHHRKRIIAKRKKQWNVELKSNFNHKQISMLATTGQPCSCYCCGNPRKHFNQLTIQERKENLKSLDIHG